MTLWQSCVLATSVILSTYSIQALGWGAVAHEIVNQAAVDGMNSAEKDFFTANLASITKLATTPDKAWKSGASRPQERPLHFLDWDRYQASSIGAAMPVSLAEARRALGADFIAKNGGSIWRVAQIYDLLVAAMKKGDCPRVIQLAGVLGHYVGDMSNPMHFTSDYDGASIGKPGIHAAFESTLVNSLNRDALLQDVEKAITEDFDKVKEQNALNESLDEGKKALEKLPAILAIYRKGGDSKALAAFLPSLMGLGASTLAHLWDEAAQDANGSSGCEASEISVANPEWIPFP